MEKEELKLICSEITELIKETNNENVYDNIITFFNLTSPLYDCRDDIESLPIAQEKPTSFTRFFNRKKAEKIDECVRDQEEEKSLLCKAISNSGRWVAGHNRTNDGEEVTKDKVYFGLRSYGDGWYPITEFEKYRTSNPKIYNAVASQMTQFIKNFAEGFGKTNWL